MQTQLRRSFQEALSGDAPEVGKLLRVAEDGKPYVEYRGSQGERIARCASAAVPPAEECANAAVLLVFEDGDRCLPIIVGFVRDSLWKAPSDTVLIEAKDAVELRCGQGSISLHADGHIVIKGEKVTSRARETNKVRGAVVLIN